MTRIVHRLHIHRAMLVVARLVALTIVIQLSVASAAAQSYAVGYRDLDLVSNSFQRPIPIRLYYPAAFAGEQAPLVRSVGDIYPLVVFSGERGVEIGAYRYFVDHLVSRGYFVAIARFAHADLVLQGRLLSDIPNALYLATWSDSALGFHRQINPRPHAIGGHGIGGAAAIIGAHYDSADGVSFTLGATITSDPTVLRYAHGMLGPSLTIAGTHDCIAPDSLNGRRIYDTLRHCKSRALITGASHCRFANVDINCQTSEAECTQSPTISREEQQRVVDSLLLPWLDWQLKNQCDGLDRFHAFIDSSRAIASEIVCDDPEVRFSLVPGDVLSICATDTATLSGPEGYAEYLWSNGATTRSIDVTGSAYVSVVARDPVKCTMRSWFTVVQALFYPPQLPPLTVLCPSSSIVLDAGYAEKYRWSNGDTTNRLVVREPGRYWVEVSRAGCTLMSDTADVIAAPPARIVVDGPVVGCIGDTTILSAPPFWKQVTWSDASTQLSRAAVHAGLYFFTGVDSNGCTIRSDSIRIDRHRAIVPEITARRDTLTSTPAKTYQWFLNNVAITGATNRVHIALTSGPYRVSITDSIGCHAMSQTWTVGNIGSAEWNHANAHSITLIGRYLRIALPCVAASSMRVAVHDVRGALVRLLNVDESQSGTVGVDLDAIASGAYLVSVDCDGECVLTELVRIE